MRGRSATLSTTGRPGSRPRLTRKLKITAELAEMLQFISTWLTAEDSDLGASLDRFVGHPAHGITQLRADLERFVFLLGGSDGESLFGPPRP
jgi:hypothetical protein